MKCWWCCHEWPDDEFLHMPFRYDDRTKVFQTTGQFCSWGCMKAYNLDAHGISQKGAAIGTYMTLMKKHMYKHTKPTKPAPSRWALECFGGKLTIEEFRAASLNMETEVKTITPLQREIYNEIVTVITKPEPMRPTKNELSHKFEEINKSTTRPEPLKLKRSKPLKREISNLETSLGIVRKRR